MTLTFSLWSVKEAAKREGKGKDSLYCSLYIACNDKKTFFTSDLPSIFRDKSVQSSIPNYLKNYEVPIICYKYYKHTRGAILNFNKLVSDLDIETCYPDF